jgi:GYF domain 2
MNTVWWYVSEGDRKGPVSEEDLSRLLATGKISANSLVWKAGMEGWQSVAQVKDLTSMLASLPPEVPLAQKTPQRTIAAPGAWHRVR